MSSVADREIPDTTRCLSKARRPHRSGQFCSTWHAGATETVVTPPFRNRPIRCHRRAGRALILQVAPAKARAVGLSFRRTRQHILAISLMPNGGGLLFGLDGTVIVTLNNS